MIAISSSMCHSNSLYNYLFPFHRIILFTLLPLFIPHNKHKTPSANNRCLLTTLDNTNWYVTSLQSNITLMIKYFYNDKTSLNCDYVP